jgi:quercetin dioxygenase-like cupin family protein
MILLSVVYLAYSGAQESKSYYATINCGHERYRSFAITKATPGGIMCHTLLQQLREMTTVVADTGDIDAIQTKPQDATTNHVSSRQLKKFILSLFIFTFGCAPTTHARQVDTPLTKQLPEGPGKDIEFITVNYALGAFDVIHWHDAHVVVYVLEREVEMQVRGGMLQRLGRGQVFCESPEDVHTVSRNASKTKPAKCVIFGIKQEREHRFSLPFTSFGRGHGIAPIKPFCLKQYFLRGGTHEFTSRATHREWDRDCPAVRTVCARSFLSIRCG